MVFVLRVRAHSGMKRLVFPSDSANWLSVQQQVADVCNVRIDHQLLSRQPLHQPEYIEADDDRTIKQLNLNNGDVLYLAGEESVSTASNGTASGTTTASSSSASLSSTARPASSTASSVATTPHIPPHKLTPDCKHNERGACAYCLPNKPGAPITPPACQHGTGVVCIHCSNYVKQANKAKDSQPATWLCNHPDTVFCNKCIPPSTEKAAVVKIDKVPFARWLDERKGLCKFKHGASVTCAFCATPPFPSFAAKVPCDKGHAPYPAAVCLSCAPPNANLRVQPYRHVDSISVESKLLSPFYSAWLRASPQPKDERAAILIGRYVPEPAETNNPGAIRAQVHALYEPPQQPIAGGVQFTKDEKERWVHEVAKRLGMEAVGWVVAVPAREGGEKYGGKILLSGAEVEQAARFQLRYAGSSGYSRFVTLLLEHAQQVEPVAFQVADMAVALEKEKSFAAASSDPFFLATRKVKQGEMTSTIIYKDRPLRGGEEFLPDELLVKVIVSAPRGRQSVFAHCEYPSGRSGENELVVKSWMSEWKDEEYEERLSDFNLLVVLCKVVGEEVVYAICDALKEKKRLSDAVRSQLDSALLAKNLL